MEIKGFWEILAKYNVDTPKRVATCLHPNSSGEGVGWGISSTLFDDQQRFLNVSAF